MERKLSNYEDSLALRRTDCSNLLWVQRKVNPVVAYKQEVTPTPNTHKEAVLFHPKIVELIEKISKENGISKHELEKQIKIILDEIGYNKNFNVIRWLGLVALKICLKVCSGIYINKDSILHTKSPLGNCPVIFVPSHRSYADFTLMSTICFQYDVAIPAIAAGMDFHGMWGMGSLLRDTGAFFMRRSYNDDSLYWITFKQYIYQLVTNGELPIEFFIEGTRSRSNKSLTPKYGLLNMVLKPLFLRDVSDILFVPINISYDRILEETLFAYELLGIPKPKESTKGFFKSLSIIKEKYGSIYFHFAKPISAKEFFGEKLNKSTHSMGPLHHQELSDYDKSIIPSLAHEIIYSQQKSCTLSVFNLAAIVLNHNLVNDRKPLRVVELTKSVMWLKDIFEKFGALINVQNLEKDIWDAITVHQNIVRFKDGLLHVVFDKVVLDNVDPKKMKGHRIADNVMTFSVPFVMLYIYINPTLHYVIDVALLVEILKNLRSQLSQDELFGLYSYFRTLLSNEFVIYEEKLREEFDNALKMANNLKLVKILNEEDLELGKNRYLQKILETLFQPFLRIYYTTSLVILGMGQEKCEERVLITEIQKKVEDDLLQCGTTHPYCLNLDSISNCLNSFTQKGILNKIRTDKVSYLINENGLAEVRDYLEPMIIKNYTGQTLQTIGLQYQNKL